MLRAVVDPDSAARDVLALRGTAPALDATLSLAAMYYWVVTRPPPASGAPVRGSDATPGADAAAPADAVAPETASPETETAPAADAADATASRETASPETAPASPEAASTALAPVSTAPAPPETASTAPETASTDASGPGCAARPRCVALGLTGDCCPTTGGDLLWCC